MRKILLTTIFATIASPFLGFSQTENTPPVKQKRFHHQVGVQVNELIRQVFQFGNGSTSANNNPYLLVYHINTLKGGWGARLGVGYTYRSFTDNDAVNKRESDINNMQLRLGIEKAFQLSGKWTVGIGVDGLYNTDNNKTISTTKAQDTSVTVSTTEVRSMGGGAMGWLRYNLTDYIVLGTETSFYYLSGDQKQDISIARRGFNQVTTSTSKTDNKTSEGVFRIPVALYLLIRF